MLYEVMKSINNFFPVEDSIQEGEWIIADGSISIPGVQNGQYFLIEGSIFNDGLHLYGDGDSLRDERFNGKITPLAIPKAFLEMVDQISEWKKQYGDAALSPFVSESFGGYSYNKGSNSSSGNTGTWEDAFKKQLRMWRKL